MEDEFEDAGMMAGVRSEAAEEKLETGSGFYKLEINYLEGESHVRYRDVELRRDCLQT